MQQHLLVILGVWLGEGVGQPVVAGHQRGEQRAAFGQDAGFVGLLVQQPRKTGDELAQRRERTRWVRGGCLGVVHPVSPRWSA
ncbi:hypothetical protein D3C86_1690790 [compost metagenome]